MSSDKVAAFAGTLAELYDRYLVPLNFAPYAEVVADRAKALLPRRVLETAAGTGVVTEALARILPINVTITATDLNEAMIERGKVGPGMERVNWQRADAMNCHFSTALSISSCASSASCSSPISGVVRQILSRPDPRRNVPVRAMGRLR